MGVEPTCRYYPTIRFRIGAVMTSSVPFQFTELYHFFVFLAKNVIIFARGGPIVYRLGHGLFKAGSGVRLSVGS